jgi:4-hydroxy-L-threonine phosphate dehydrogenase PdxA
MEYWEMKSAAIEEAITRVPMIISVKRGFVGPIVPDIAFTPTKSGVITMIAAMYHDQGLAPLKALYFDEGINVSLGTCLSSVPLSIMGRHLISPIKIKRLF